MPFADAARRCRLCGGALRTTFADLGSMPPANNYPVPGAPEHNYPLHAMVCDECHLVQLAELVDPRELFSDYAYFSSYSDTFLRHAEAFADLATRRLRLGPESFVIEVASNDGYLLRRFIARGIPVLGIDPAENVAAVARAAGVPTDTRFFGAAVAEEITSGGRADLIVANNVFAHAPDLQDFVAGLATAVKPAGVIAIEVPHLLRLIEGLQLDTIYHEHVFYFSLATAERALALHGLEVFDVEEIPTHGGSLRVWAAPAEAGRGRTPAVDAVLAAEQDAGLHRPETYTAFAARAQVCREEFVAFLRDAAAGGRSVAAYGAAAKGATLLNWCGITPAELPFVADRSPYKQGRRLPGCGIPIVPPAHVEQTRPDYLVILPWNFKDEIVKQMGMIRSWGGRFVTAIPHVEVHS
jgi:SAM-dependent methyltransferase